MPRAGVITRKIHTGRAAPAPEFLARRATPEDVEAAVELIYLPMGRFADHLFGADDADRARHVLAQLFVREENRFSHEFCDVLQADGEVVALLLSYPSALLGDLAVPMGKHLREIIGWSGMFGLLRRSLPLLRDKETEPDEYYIFTLAVREEFQKHGLGKRLMFHAEERARGAALAKCSLGVTLNNENARGFYEHLGYEVIDIVHTPSLEKAIDYPGYYRMVKHLNGAPSDRVA